MSASSIIGLYTPVFFPGLSIFILDKSTSISSCEDFSGVEHPQIFLNHSIIFELNTNICVILIIKHEKDKIIT